MADSKITGLAALTTADPANDMLPIVDVSDNSMAASGTTKRISINNILACSPSATLASATITGDLTVDTSTLKVDSANDRVGIGTASPAQFVHLSKSNTSTALTSPPVGGASLRIQNSSSTNNNFGSVEFYNAAGLFGASVNCQYTNQATPTNDLVFVTRGSSGGLEHYRIAADGVATWSEVGGVSGTAMTLNSTGLGVGGSVLAKISAYLTSTATYNSAAAGDDTDFQISRVNNSAVSGQSSTIALNSSSDNGANVARVYLACVQESNASYASSFTVKTRNSAGTSAERFRIDSSGNVGIGVTPITSHILSCAGPVGITGTTAGTRTSYITNSSAASLYYTDGGGSGYFTDFGNLIIQPRTSAARSVVIATGSTTPVERAVVKSTGQVRFVPLAADPAGAEAGDVYYNSSSNKLKCYNGTTWNDLF